MTFELNGYEFKIQESDVVVINSNTEYNGKCDCNEGIIELKQDLKPLIKRRVLVHEIMHAVIWSYGIRQYDEEISFDEEQLCGLIERYFDTILSIVNQYFKENN